MARAGQINSNTDVPSTAEAQATAAALASSAASAVEIKLRSRAAIVGLTSGDFAVSAYPSASACLAAARQAAATILIRNGIYELTSDFQQVSGRQIEGESEDGVILRMVGGVNKSMITSTTSTGIITGVTLRNLTLDQQGPLQTAGGGIVVAGMQSWLIENLTILTARRFNFLTLHQGNVPDKPGTITVTYGSEFMVGVGTTFLSDFQKRDIIKTPAGAFPRVAEVVSDTVIRLDALWGFPTETGVSYKKIEANSFNVLRNVKMKGTLEGLDTSGYGFFDGGLVVASRAEGSTGGGCGFVPDHTRGMRFEHCIAKDNANAGFSYETSTDITNVAPHSFGAGNGVQLISGSSRNRFIAPVIYNNINHGISINYNNTNFPQPSNNRFTEVNIFDNGGYGMRVDGGDRNYVEGEIYRNNLGGIIQNTAGGKVPTKNRYRGNVYDDRTTKVAPRGVWIVTGNATDVEVQVDDSDFTTAGIVDTGTGTTQLTKKDGNLGVNNRNPKNRLNVNTPNVDVTGLEAILAGSSTTARNLGLMLFPGQTGNLLELLSSAGNIIGNITSGGLSRLQTASAAAPTYSWAAEGTSGMYRPSGTANTVRFAVAANDAMELNVSLIKLLKGLQLKRTTVGNVNYPLVASDCLVEHTSLGSAKTDTLADATAAAGQIVGVIDGSGSAGTYPITVTASTGQLAADVIISKNYGMALFYSNGTRWISLLENTDVYDTTRFTATSSKNVVNTAAKVTALPTGGKGNRQLPAGFWVPGRSLIVEPDGTYQTPAVPGSVTVRVEMGGVVLASVNVAASVLAAGSTVFALWGRVKITCRTSGAAGTFVANGYLMFQTGAAGTIPVPINSGNGEVTVDTTTAMTPDVTEQWSNAQSGQGTTINDLTVYVKN